MIERPPPIDTDRLTLVALLPDDIQALVAGDTEQAGASAGVQFPSGWPVEQEAREGLPWHLRHLNADATHIPWRIRVIAERPSGCVVGSINLKGPPNQHGDVEIGWGISEPYRRFGYAYEATAAVIGWVAEHPTVKSVSATVPADNTPSQRLAAKLGMSPTLEVRRSLPVWRLEL